MEKSIENEAGKLLSNFFEEMYNWEKNAYSCLDPDNPESLNGAKESLISIYSKYLTNKVRKTGLSSGPSIGSSPRFNNSLEKIKSTYYDKDKKKIYIETEREYENTPDYKEKHKYTFVVQKEKLLLDKNEKYSPFKEKWINEVF